MHKIRNKGSVHLSLPFWINFNTGSSTAFNSTLLDILGLSVEKSLNTSINLIIISNNYYGYKKDVCKTFLH